MHVLQVSAAGAHSRSRGTAELRDREPRTSPSLVSLNKKAQNSKDVWQNVKTKLQTAALACSECGTLQEAVVHKPPGPSDIPPAPSYGANLLDNLRVESKVKSQPMFLAINS